MKLSNRLQQIDKMVTAQYDHIWDCCCDHGLLGFSLLSRLTNSKLHFVDIVPKLMLKVADKLECFFPNSPWQTHCIDVAKLPLTRYQGQHLIIIAGVGGDLMMQFIEAINQQHKNLNIDFLLCPVHHQFALRQKLIALDFSLKDEVLIAENRRFYEILLVSSNSAENSEITTIGDKIWQPTSQHQREIVHQYLHKTLHHYQRTLKGIKQDTRQNQRQDKIDKVQDIIDAYRSKVSEDIECSAKHTRIK